LAGKPALPESTKAVQDLKLTALAYDQVVVDGMRFPVEMLLIIYDEE
jgi:hypothetical protein